MLRYRLLVEQERLRRMPTQYPWNRAEAFAKLQELVPDVTEAEFDDLELAGKIDFLYINGEKRYFVRFHKTLVKAIPDLVARSGGRTDGVSPWLDPMIAEIKAHGSLAYRITLKGAMHLEASAFVPDTYRIHIPVPAHSAQQRDISIDAPGAVLAPADAEARCAYWEKKLDAWERRSAVLHLRQRDSLRRPVERAEAPCAAVSQCAARGACRFGGGCAVSVRFTPYLKQLAAELSAGAEDDVHKAKHFYDFVQEGGQVFLCAGLFPDRRFGRILCGEPQGRLRLTGAAVHSAVPRFGHSCPLAERLEH